MKLLFQVEKTHTKKDNMLVPIPIEYSYLYTSGALAVRKPVIVCFKPLFCDGRVPDKSNSTESHVICLKIQGVFYYLRTRPVYNDHSVI